MVRKVEATQQVFAMDGAAQGDSMVSLNTFLKLIGDGEEELITPVKVKSEAAVKKEENASANTSSDMPTVKIDSIGERERASSAMAAIDESSPESAAGIEASFCESTTAGDLKSSIETPVKSGDMHPATASTSASSMDTGTHHFTRYVYNGKVIKAANNEGDKLWKVILSADASNIQSSELQQGESANLRNRLYRALIAHLMAQVTQIGNTHDETAKQAHQAAAESDRKSCARMPFFDQYVSKKLRFGARSMEQWMDAELRRVHHAIEKNGRHAAPAVEAVAHDWAFPTCDLKLLLDAGSFGELDGNVLKTRCLPMEAFVGMSFDGEVENKLSEEAMAGAVRLGDSNNQAVASSSSSDSDDAGSFAIWRRNFLFALALTIEFVEKLDSYSKNVSRAAQDHCNRLRGVMNAALHKHVSMGSVSAAMTTLNSSRILTNLTAESTALNILTNTTRRCRRSFFPEMDDNDKSDAEGGGEEEQTQSVLDMILENQRRAKGERFVQRIERMVAAVASPEQAGKSKQQRR